MGHVIWPKVQKKGNTFENAGYKSEKKMLLYSQSYLRSHLSDLEKSIWEMFFSRTKKKRKIPTRKFKFNEAHVLTFNYGKIRHASFLRILGAF